MTRRILSSIGAALVLLFAILYLMFPSLFHKTAVPIEVDYSQRYYELADKKTLTEAELKEFEREKEKGDAEMLRAYEDWKRSNKGTK